MERFNSAQDIFDYISLICSCKRIEYKTLDVDDSWIHHDWSKQPDGRDLEIMDFDEWARRN